MKPLDREVERLLGYGLDERSSARNSRSALPVAASSLNFAFCEK